MQRSSWEKKCMKYEKTTVDETTIICIATIYRLCNECVQNETYCGCNFIALGIQRATNDRQTLSIDGIGDKQLSKIHNGLSHTPVTVSKYQPSVEQNIVTRLLRCEVIFSQLNQTTEAVRQARGSRFLLGIYVS